VAEGETEGFAKGLDGCKDEFDRMVVKDRDDVREVFRQVDLAHSLMCVLWGIRIELVL
jgi:hypothetical protein